MERLTKWWDGRWTIDHKTGADKYTVIDQLAKYESTGLTPEEIKKLVIDVSKGDISAWQNRLMQMLLDRYNTAADC